MQASQLRPAYEFARKYGAKAVAYGPPGSGKTPIFNTAPRPVLLACEPGLMSMRNSAVPTWDAGTPERIDEFFAWLLGSAESRNFDSVGIDSASQMAEIYLNWAKSLKNQDGRAIYGKMSEKVQQHLNGLFFMQQKHAYIICKQSIEETDGSKKKRPYFPGQELNIRIPHLYDLILHVDTHNIPGVGPQRAFRTAASFDAIARDRSGMLAEYEPCNLTHVFAKVMS